MIRNVIASTLLILLSTSCYSAEMSASEDLSKRVGLQNSYSAMNVIRNFGNLYKDQDNTMQHNENLVHYLCFGRLKDDNFTFIPPVADAQDAYTKPLVHHDKNQTRVDQKEDVFKTLLLAAFKCEKKSWGGSLSAYVDQQQNVMPSLQGHLSGVKGFISMAESLAKNRTADLSVFSTRYGFDAKKAYEDLSQTLETLLPPPVLKTANSVGVGLGSLASALSSAKLKKTDSSIPSGRAPRTLVGPDAPIVEALAKHTMGISVINVASIIKDNEQLLAGKNHYEVLSLIAQSVQLGIKKLNLDGCKDITDEAVLDFVKGKGIEELSLNGCKRITDNVITRMQGRIKDALRFLFLDGTQITDSGLGALKSIKNLENLSLKDCQAVTEDNVNAVHNYYPQREIEIIHPNGLKTTRSATKIVAPVNNVTTANIQPNEVDIIPSFDEAKRRLIGIQLPQKGGTPPQTPKIQKPSTQQTQVPNVGGNKTTTSRKPSTTQSKIVSQSDYFDLSGMAESALKNLIDDASCAKITTGNVTLKDGRVITFKEYCQLPMPRPQIQGPPPLLKYR